MSIKMRQLQAIRALRLNYRWRGVWIWLRARQGLGLYGWQEVLLYPDDVRALQEAIAEGHRWAA